MIKDGDRVIAFPNDRYITIVDSDQRIIKSHAIMSKDSFTKHTRERARVKNVAGYKWDRELIDGTLYQIGHSIANADLRANRCEILSTGRTTNVVEMSQPFNAIVFNAVEVVIRSLGSDFDTVEKVVMFKYDNEKLTELGHKPENFKTLPIPYRVGVVAIFRKGTRIESMSMIMDHKV
jgi:hypothetical protein